MKFFAVLLPLIAGLQVVVQPGWAQSAPSVTSVNGSSPPNFSGSGIEDTFTVAASDPNSSNITEIYFMLSDATWAPQCEAAIIHDYSSSTDAVYILSDSSQWQQASSGSYTGNSNCWLDGSLNGGGPGGFTTTGTSAAAGFVIRVREPFAGQTKYVYGAAMDALGMNSSWVFSGYWAVPSMGLMTSPSPGSTLSGSSVTFSWSAGSSVSYYTLSVYDGTTYVGSWTYLTGTSQTVTGIPQDGGTVTVLLATYYPNWGLQSEYLLQTVTYTAAP